MMLDDRFRKEKKDDVLKSDRSKEGDKGSKDSLIKGYGIVDKIDPSSLSIKDKAKRPISIDGSVADQPPENVSETLGNIVSIDYFALKQDIKRLEDYEDLSKDYKLTQEQFEAVAEIYGRVKEATISAEKLGSDYQQISDRLKEISELSKKVLEEVSGNYIKDISEYRHAP